MRLIYTLSFYALLLLPNTLGAQTLNYIWANSGLSTANGVKIAVDTARNTYVVGQYSGGIFANQMLTGYGNEDVFLAKYNAAGVLQWVRGCGGTNVDFAGGVALDGAGGVYITGTYLTSAMKFSPTDSLPAATLAENVFVAKYTTSGTFQWAQAGQSQPSKNARANAITITRTGDVLIGGFFSDYLGFSSALLSGGPVSLFLASFSGSGTYQWGKVGSSINNCQLNTLTTDAAGNIYAGGKYSAPLWWDTTSLANSTGMDMAFLAKFTSTGKLRWMKKEGKGGGLSTNRIFDCINSIVLSPSGALYAGGSLLDTFYTPVSGPVVSRQWAFVARYDTAGNQQWIQKWGPSSAYNTVNSMALDGSGNIHCIGSYSGAMTVGNTTLPVDNVSGAIFTTKLDASGNIAWTLGTNGNGNDIGSGIAVDSAGSIFTTGHVTTGGVLGGSLVNAAGAFIARQSIVYPPPPPPQGIGAGISKEMGISLWPNPAQDVLHLHCNAGQMQTIVLYDAMGRKLKQVAVTGNEHQLNLAGLPVGRYQLVVYGTAGTATAGFVREQ
jgi:hypothetical protein